MPRGVSVTESVAAANPALDLDDLRRLIRVDDHDFDHELAIRLGAATRELEIELGQCFVNRTLVEYFSCFDDPLILRGLPVSSVTSVKYLDDDGDEQTLSTDVYDVDSVSLPGMIRLAVGEAWPGVYTSPAPVYVTYVAGYGADESSVPDSIKQLLSLRVGYYFEHAGSDGSKQAEGTLAASSFAEKFVEFG